MWKNETITYTYIYPLAEKKRGIEIFMFPQFRKMNDMVSSKKVPSNQLLVLFFSKEQNFCQHAHSIIRFIQLC